MKNYKEYDALVKMTENIQKDINKTMNTKEKDLNNRDLFFELIKLERERQNRKFPNEQKQQAVSFHEWNTILTEEVGEFSREVNDREEFKALVELAECAAVCFKIVDVYYHNKKHLLKKAYKTMAKRTAEQKAK